MAQLDHKNIRGFLKLAKSQNYKVFERPYELNIWGVRKDTTVPNKFDDKIYVFWKDANLKWDGKVYDVTTDPGTFWLKTPMKEIGTAIMKQGQYIDAYALGLHKGKDALVQVGPITVFRDYDRDAVLDFNNGREETGMFAVNIHRAGTNSEDVNNWSAGCQVFKNLASFEEFLTLARKHKALYGNKFSYGLVDERAYLRRLRKRGVYIAGGIAIALAIWIGYRLYKSKSVIPKM